MPEFKNMRKRTTFMMSAGALGIVAASAFVPAQGAQAPARVEFDIPAKELSAALKDYSIATDQQVIFAVDLVRDKRAPAVSGAVDSGEALNRLLKDTGLSYERTETDVIVIRPLQQQAMLVQQPARVAMLQEISEPDEDAEQDSGSEPKKRDEITVTGTLIKGIAPESSPMQMFSREDILESGATTTEQFIRLLPQNFGGGSSEFSPGGLPNDANSRFNTSNGTSANLRGLGSRGTLVLLNGNRIAPTSEVGDFIDLSLIPVSALERVDVLSDGASSIYGGDAVAGVINFVLRDDFEGSETAMRVGSVTSGEMKEYRASQTLGAAWEKGNILATYEFFDRQNLTLADRGDIAAPSPVVGVLLPGLDLFDLMPEQRRHSAVVSFDQAVTDVVSLGASALYSNRQSQSTTFSALSGSVAESNAKSENLTLNSGADIRISNDWSLTVDATYSQIRNDQILRDITSEPHSQSEYVSNSDLWAVDAVASGNVLELPAGFAKIAIGGHYRREKFSSGGVGRDLTRDGIRNVYAVFGEVAVPLVGASNERPGIQRLELNASGRLDDYSDFGTTINPKVGLLWSPFDRFNLRGSYSTSFAPPSLGRVGALDRNANVFPYAFILNIVGLTSPDPSLDDVSYMLTSGTAADLDPETSRTFTGGIDYAIDRDSHSLSLRATYYDISFDGRLGSTPVPGNQNLNIGPHIAFSDPDAFPDGTIVFFPSGDELDALISTLTNPPYLRLGAALDDVGIINNMAVVRNLASTKTRGIDVQIDYATETDIGTFSAALNANYIVDFIEQAYDATPAIDIVNSLYNPVDLRVRGKLGYASANFSASAFVNYTDGYRTDATTSSLPIDSWTTVDMFVSYRFSNGPVWLNDTAINLSVSNLFDQEPPSVPPSGAFTIAGYDPANASPLNRFIALELRKSF